MPFNDLWKYTPPAAATDAFAGKVIASADWNTCFTDVSTAITQLGQTWIVTTGINFNSANTDTLITVPLPTGFSNYQIKDIIITGASHSISTATCGVFTAAAGGGTPIVTSATTLTLTATAANTNNNMQALTVNNAGTLSYNLATLYFRVQTPESAAATANVLIHIAPLP